MKDDHESTIDDMVRHVRKGANMRYVIRLSSYSAADDTMKLGINITMHFIKTS